MVADGQNIGLQRTFGCEELSLTLGLEVSGEEEAAASARDKDGEGVVIFLLVIEAGRPEEAERRGAEGEGFAGGGRADGQVFIFRHVHEGVIDLRVGGVGRSEHFRGRKHIHRADEPRDVVLVKMGRDDRIEGCHAVLF